MAFIPLEVFANNPSTTVSSGGTTAPAAGTAETWTVTSSASFPAVKYGAQQFHVADPAQPSEMCAVQAVSGTTRTGLRGAEGGLPGARAAGCPAGPVGRGRGPGGRPCPAGEVPAH